MLKRRFGTQSLRCASRNMKTLHLYSAGILNPTRFSTNQTVRRNPRVSVCGFQFFLVTESRRESAILGVLNSFARGHTAGDSLPQAPVGVLRWSTTRKLLGQHAWEWPGQDAHSLGLRVRHSEDVTPGVGRQPPHAHAVQRVRVYQGEVWQRKHEEHRRAECRADQVGGIGC